MKHSVIEKRYKFLTKWELNKLLILDYFFITHQYFFSSHLKKNKINLQAVLLATENHLILQSTFHFPAPHAYIISVNLQLLQQVKTVTAPWPMSPGDCESDIHK